MADRTNPAEDRVSPSPAAGTRTLGARAPAVGGDNLGVIATGDHVRINQVQAVPFPPPDRVRPAARVVGLPRPATAVFVGRDDAYRGLEQALAASVEVVVSQAVYGMGGVGKSELAL
ncbi:hypothetical protein ABZ801_30540 [Actinomadura sp. NPDC047616]